VSRTANASGNDERGSGLPLHAFCSILERLKVELFDALPISVVLMLNIRTAVLKDVPTLLALIQEMAEYERLPCLMTEQLLVNDGFGRRPRFRVVMAEFDGEPAGYALFFDSYSTFQGRGLFLEDLYVRPRFRKKKVGHALLSRVAAIAEDESCFGIIFHVLDWNETAIEFYKKMNATFLDDWKTICLKDKALRLVAHSV
jgi:GNAT superfamily N-acetyltransferase